MGNTGILKSSESDLTTMLGGSKASLRRGKFEFELRHLLVIVVLAICFTTAFIMRAYPAKYGFYLNEFDPYFDYRTKYIVDNGLKLTWNGMTSCHGILRQKHTRNLTIRPPHNLSPPIKSLVAVCPY